MLLGFGDLSFGSGVGVSGLGFRVPLDEELIRVDLRPNLRMYSPLLAAPYPSKRSFEYIVTPNPRVETFV